MPTSDLFRDPNLWLATSFLLPDSSASDGVGAARGVA